jgi:hypothetical protein
MDELPLTPSDDEGDLEQGRVAISAGNGNGNGHEVNITTLALVTMLSGIVAFVFWILTFAFCGFTPRSGQSCTDNPVVKIFFHIALECTALMFFGVYLNCRAESQPVDTCVSSSLAKLEDCTGSYPARRFAAKFVFWTCAAALLVLLTICSDMPNACETPVAQRVFIFAVVVAGLSCFMNGGVVV